MPAPRLCLILSENWTMTSGRDLPSLVRWAREAEDAGFDSVMISEHIVLGPAAAGSSSSPTVSWLAQEYAALGVPFTERGDLLDEHLAAWATLWRDTPASHDGPSYPFRDVFFEPKAFRPEGPPLWFGGSVLHPRMVRRIVRYGAGFNPLGRPASQQLRQLTEALLAAGRDPAALELVGGTRAVFPDGDGVADLGQALSTIPPQAAAGFTTFCIKPSQFTDDPAGVGALCRDIVRRTQGLLP
jgi:alkanesulfonate monooxygenase SsuD/methylene tetrahydromethanopterin reductase-like flavin-dependent oxidoreductase (luciferase family)